MHFLPACFASSATAGIENRPLKLATEAAPAALTPVPGAALESGQAATDQSVLNGGARNELRAPWQSRPAHVAAERGSADGGDVTVRPTCRFSPTACA